MICSFCDFVFSFSIMFSSFIRVVVCDTLLQAYTTVSSPSHLAVDTWVAATSGIMNNAMMNMECMNICNDLALSSFG